MKEVSILHNYHEMLLLIFLYGRSIINKGYHDLKLVAVKTDKLIYK